MLINHSMPDELWKQCIEESPTNPWRGVLQKLTRFAGVKNGERITLFRAEQQKDLEALYGKPIEDLDAFVAWVKGLKSLGVEGSEERVVLKEGQRKQIQGLSDHYKEPFASRAKKVIEDAMDKQVGNY